MAEQMTDMEFYESRCNGKTIGDFYRGVFSIDNPEDAQRFYRGCIANAQAQIDTGTWKSTATAEQAAKSNIGWVFGEGMEPSRIAMWAQATGASHPVFGTMSVSPADALNAGLKAGASK